MPRRLRFISEVPFSKTEGSRFIQNHYVSLPNFMALYPIIVRIATRYGLEGPGIEIWWLWDFPHPSILAPRPTHPRVKWGIGSSVKEILRGRSVDHPLQFSTDVEERVDL